MEKNREERRQHERMVYNTEAELKTDTSHFTCYTMNISAGGILVKTDEPLTVGEKIEIGLHLPNLARQTRVKGLVIRRAGNTFGIRFDKPVKTLLSK